MLTAFLSNVFGAALAGAVATPISTFYTAAELDEVLKAAAVSVLPSLSEGISNTLLESMAAGVPVVATRVGGTPEAVTDGEQGLLVPPGDSEALAAAISRVLSDPLLATRLGDNGRRRVAEEFSFEAVVRRTEALYRELLAAKSR